MYIQGILIAGFLFYEITIVILLISPIFGPKNYKNIYYFWLFFTCKVYHSWLYFLSLLGLLTILLFDSMREMQKFSRSNNSGNTQPSTDLKGSVNFFKAQSNFYISGFNIFLAIVIWRLLTTIMNHYEMQLKGEMIMKKTKDTVKLAKTRLSEADQFLEEHKLKELKEVATTQDRRRKAK